MTKFSERTSIPITWVFAAYVPTTTFVLMVAWWVFNVDHRLHRIEHRLGIAVEQEAQNPLIKDVQASQ